jgi:apolipoprotein N-acyltransferase
VGIAQGNVEQDRKWDPEFQGETMRRYDELTRAAVRDGAQVVVWPETAAPFFFQEPGALRDEVVELARTTRTPLLIGSPAFERMAGRIEQRNRAYLVGDDGATGDYYDKMQLVPFGEYVPFQRILFFVDQMVHAVGSLGAGTAHTVFRIPEGRFGVLICYEGIFPDLTRRFVADGADFLVNITNDAWYGRTAAPRQHLIQATFRAIENRVPLVRAANTGISAIVDPDGRLRWQGPLFEMVAHVEEIRWTGVRTFYTRFGDVFVGLCALVTLAGLWRAATRKPS